MLAHNRRMRVYVLLAMSAATLAIVLGAVSALATPLERNLSHGFAPGPRVSNESRRPDPAAPAQPTIGVPTAAPPIVLCPTRSVQPLPGLYPDLAVAPPYWHQHVLPDCALGPMVLRARITNVGSAPAIGFWVRADGCLAVTLQERIEVLEEGRQVELEFAPIGSMSEPCRVQGDAECELDDRTRDDNLWSGPVPIPTLPPCTPETTPTPTEDTTPTPTSDATDTATATTVSVTPEPRYVPWSKAP